MGEFKPDELGIATTVLDQNQNTPVERVKIEHRLGVLDIDNGKRVVRYFDTYAERWEDHAETYLNYGDRINAKRIVWLENRVVIETEWYQ